MSARDRPRPLPLLDALHVARLWAAAGGARRVELGALEPLLWRDGGHRPADLVRALRDENFDVSLTTNGSLLGQHASDLAAARLSLARVSWHTCDPALFREIAGIDCYDMFREGIDAAARARLPMAFNRVLFRGHTDDLPRQLDFVEDQGARLKLYELMWTPEIAHCYSDIHQRVMPVIDRHVAPRAIAIDRIEDSIGRARLRYRLRRGGSVEIKLGNEVDRGVAPCSRCRSRGVCEEAFGDYLRVEANLQAFFCYMRRDIGFDLNRVRDAGELITSLRAHFGEATEELLRASTLRYILMPRCNFNCYLPGTNRSWCHKRDGNYRWPRRDVAAARVPVAQAATAFQHDRQASSSSSIVSRMALRPRKTSWRMPASLIFRSRGSAPR